MAVDMNEFCYTLTQKLFSEQIRSATAILPNQGTLAWVLSDQNRNAGGFSVELDPGSDGKRHDARIRFLQRTPLSAYDSTPGTYCDPVTPKSYQFQSLAIDQERRSEVFTFQYKQMRDFCEGKSNHIAEVINSGMQSLKSALNRDLVTLISSGGFVGNFAGGVAGPKVIPLFQTTENKINPLGEIVMEEDMTDAELGGMMPVKIGAGLLRRYAIMKSIACCNDAGFNAGQLAQINGYILDTTIDTVEGVANNIWVMVPGALQFVDTNHNRGEFEFRSPDHIKITMPDNQFPNLLWDFYAKFAHCNDGEAGDDDYDTVYNVQLVKRWTAWGYPSDLFATGDSLEGVKDVFHYIGECSDDTVCESILS